MKLLETTTNETAKDENGKNMSPLEITKLGQANLSNEYKLSSSLGELKSK